MIRRFFSTTLNPVLIFLRLLAVILLAEQKGGVVATIPAASVTQISHGQDVHRRVGTAIGLAVVSLGICALMLLSKSQSTLLVSHGPMATRRAALSCNAIRATIAGSCLVSKE
jgi:hypothetical protein